ncbi:hypothetical protein PsYK624_020320 [Phanerochaete sordida]|uniref:Uncharacterized protein n=1 Tax=Phanerochaete sordida TaxID=48140 RepID=A0A9P3G0N8_9APHY|nr:hypothetical protein PsYK624_020320 [Phanerochaete sordida]
MAHADLDAIRQALPPLTAPSLAGAYFTVDLLATLAAGWPSLGQLTVYAAAPRDVGTLRAWKVQHTVLEVLTVWRGPALAHNVEEIAPIAAFLARFFPYATTSAPYSPSESDAV